MRLELAPLLVTLTLAACGGGSAKHYIVWPVWTSGQSNALSTYTDLQKCDANARDLSAIAVRDNQPFRNVSLPEGTTPIVAASARTLTPGKTYLIKPDGTPEEVKVIDFKDLKK